MLHAAAINMYKREHGPSISGTGTRGVDLRKVLCVLMKTVVKVQYVSRFVTVTKLHNIVFEPQLWIIAYI